MSNNRPQSGETASPRPKARTAAQAADLDVAARADGLAREGRLQEALAVLDDGIAAGPDRRDLWRQKARIFRQIGETGKANEILDTALKRFKNEPDLLIDKAELQLAEGHFFDASKTFGRIVKIEPHNANGWLGKGQSLLYAGSAEQALRCANRVIEFDHGSSLGYILKGDSQLQLRRWDEAFAAFSQAATSGPDSFGSSSWSARGDQLFWTFGQPEVALRAYEHAIEADPKNPEAWHGKGTVLKSLGKLDDAVQAFVSAIKEDKSFVAAYLDAGAICVERGDLDRALEMFKQAREARSNDARPWIAIGGVYERREDYEEARAAYEQAARINPDDAETWNSVGNCLVNLDLLDAAVQSYQKAITVNPEYAWPYYNMAGAFARFERFDKAIQSIDRAIEIEPENPSFWQFKLAILSTAEQTKDVDAIAGRVMATIGTDLDERIIAAGVLADADQIDRMRELIRDTEPTALHTDEARLSFAECLLVSGDYASAAALLGEIDAHRLTNWQSVVRAFLRLVAARLGGGTFLSEELLVDFLDEFQTLLDRFEAKKRRWRPLSLNWSWRSVRRVLTRSQLPILDKLVLATLIDLQEAKVQRTELSFFSGTRPKSVSAPASA